MSRTSNGLPSLDLRGQTAFVTGASSGLGQRFATVLALAGAKVVAVGRRRERLDELVSEIRAAGGVAEPLALDVADTAALPEAVAAAERALGLVSILVNCAGIPDAQLATRMPADLIDAVIDVNLKAPFILSRSVAKRLIEEKRPGRIVNISSIAALTLSKPGAALYSTTKAAVIRMTEALAVEWAAFDINVNAIAPGSFDTEMMDGMRGRIGDDFIQKYPRKRLAQPHQLDSTLLYLVSPTSDAVTGAVITVDDGQSPR